MILLDGSPKLFIWIENDKVHFEDTCEKDDKDVCLIYNFSKNFVSSVDKEDKILIRLLGKNHLKTLVAFMNSTFIPNIIEQNSWP